MPIRPLIKFPKISNFAITVFGFWNHCALRGFLEQVLFNQCLCECRWIHRRVGTSYGNHITE